MITRYVQKVLLCPAICLQTQQPAGQKKEGDQEHAEYGHNALLADGLNRGVQELFFLLTPCSNVSTASGTSSEQECSFPGVQTVCALTPPSLRPMSEMGIMVWSAV